MYENNEFWNSNQEAFSEFYSPKKVKIIFKCCSNLLRIKTAVRELSSMKRNHNVTTPKIKSLFHYWNHFQNKRTISSQKIHLCITRSSDTTLNSNLTLSERGPDEAWSVQQHPFAISMARPDSIKRVCSSVEILFSDYSQNELIKKNYCEPYLDLFLILTNNSSKHPCNNISSKIDSCR